MTWFNGWKSYLAALGLLVFAIYGLTTGNLTTDQGIALIINALAVFGLRNAIANLK